LRLPIFLLPFCLLSKYFVATLVWSIIIICPNHFALLFLIFVTRSGGFM
jgi:hypothetical protein